MYFSGKQVVQKLHKEPLLCSFIFCTNEKRSKFKECFWYKLYYT